MGKERKELKKTRWKVRRYDTGKKASLLLLTAPAAHEHRSRNTGSDGATLHESFTIIGWSRCEPDEGREMVRPRNDIKGNREGRGGKDTDEW
ncbi:hypothetical protein E2C01_095649 [Portunus trituberculatus]|uniref:Uncharacterized protein n=1 Tax=Portunus trituberculatus TaxID=210409 RepID=A0A5B7JTJ4_PORTR|nr:hypothetical protein [Portunus trituberculatus]